MAHYFSPFSRLFITVPDIILSFPVSHFPFSYPFLHHLLLFLEEKKAATKKCVTSFFQKNPFSLIIIRMLMLCYTAAITRFRHDESAFLFIMV